MRFHHYILLILLTGCKLDSYINGYVKDGNSGELISDVQVNCVDGINHIIFTDEEGNFKTNLYTRNIFADDSFTFEFKKVGYLPHYEQFLRQDSSFLIIHISKDLAEFNNVRKEVLDTVLKIERENFISSGFMGYSGNTPDQYYRRYWLQSYATTEELNSLIDFPNNVVKATAFEGLYRKGVDVSNILLEFSKENNKLLYFSGCVGDDLLLSEYCFKNVMLYALPGEPPQPENLNTKMRLNENDKETVVNNILKMKDL